MIEVIFLLKANAFEIVGILGFATYVLNYTALTLGVLSSQSVTYL
jgi:hypothetical protein